MGGEGVGSGELLFNESGALQFGKMKSSVEGGGDGSTII